MGDFYHIHLTRELAVSIVLTLCWNWELVMATNFANLAQMVNVYGQILATTFGFVPNCSLLRVP